MEFALLEPSTVQKISRHSEWFDDVEKKKKSKSLNSTFEISIASTHPRWKNKIISLLFAV